MAGFELNQDGIEALKKQLAGKLDRGMDSFVEVAQEVLHKRTGRNAASARKDQVVINNDSIESALLVGGIYERGIYEDQAVERLVDYSLHEELVHPQLRNHLGEMVDALIETMEK